jgi:hypothetical protein
MIAPFVAVSNPVRGSLGDCLTGFIASFQTGDQLIKSTFVAS